ncbi:hypothetical protein AAC03nite_11620 [Alicyclobacillus acidoterrestris]|nr:hypothetical protein AAC03nite_11620 [Alicyclobacillus acidoterrestris]
MLGVAQRTPICYSTFGIGCNLACICRFENASSKFDDGGHGGFNFKNWGDEDESPCVGALSIPDQEGHRNS